MRKLLPSDDEDDDDDDDTGHQLFLFLFCCNFKLCSFLFAVISSQQTLTVKMLTLSQEIWLFEHEHTPNALTLKCDAVQRSAIMQHVDTEYLSYKVLTTLPPPLHDDVHVR
jgi:hypothetical protein